jgi:hypothetical protein
MADDKGPRLTLRSLSGQIDLLAEQVGAVDGRLTERVADLDDRLNERVQLMATSLSDRIGQLDDRLVPLQEHVATLHAAVTTLIGLDGVAQEMANLVELAGAALSVLGPPAPPGPGVATAIERLAESTSPNLELGELLLDNAASPFIGDPGLYLIQTTGRILP